MNALEIIDGNLNHSLAFLTSLGTKFAIIADDIVASLYGDNLAQLLGGEVFTFPHGEKNKSRETKQDLEDRLFKKGYGSDTCMIGLGGGVTTDLAGFLAATYCRGVPHVLIPTSLLAMVDACLGGKTGVNTPEGKNLVGCFYQPKKVLIDLSTLRTLPKKELQNGMVEMIKHGLIADEAFFEFLEAHAERLLNLDFTVLKSAVYQSCKIKHAIVDKNERKGKRDSLNFGHTVGHALEHLSRYTLSHGEAVAIGMLVEAKICVQLGLLSQSVLDRIHHILTKFHLTLRLPSLFSEKSILDAMQLDKKTLNGKLHFAMISKIGTPLSFRSLFTTSVDESQIKQALQWMNNELHRH